MGACKATGDSSRSLASIRVHAWRIRTRSWNSSRGCLTQERPPSSSTFRRGQRDRSPVPCSDSVLGWEISAELQRVGTLCLLLGAVELSFFIVAWRLQRREATGGRLAQ
jgi:hypothetical protein